MAIFKQAPGVSGTGHGAAESGVDFASLTSIDQIATAYWPVLLGLVLAGALVAFGRREASLLTAGLAVLLQATLVLSTQ